MKDHRQRVTGEDGGEEGCVRALSPTPSWKSIPAVVQHPHHRCLHSQSRPLSWARPRGKRGQWGPGLQSPGAGDTVMVLLYHSSSGEEPFPNPFCQLGASREAVRSRPVGRAHHSWSPGPREQGHLLCRGKKGVRQGEVEAVGHRRADGEKQSWGRGACVRARGKGPYLMKTLHFCHVSPFTDEQTEPRRG